MAGNRAQNTAQFAFNRLTSVSLTLWSFRQITESGGSRHSPYGRDGIHTLTV